MSARLDLKQWAGYWGIALRTAQHWHKQGLPISRPLEMANQILLMKRPHPKALAKAHELLSRNVPPFLPSDPPGCDARSGATAPKNESLPPINLDDFAGDEVSLEVFRGYCVAQMRQAAEMRPMDQANVTYWHERFLKTDKAIRDAELHAQKMGVSEGQIITREEFERLLFAIGFWILRGVEIDINALAPRLVGLDYPEEAAAVLDRFFIRSRFFAAFAKSITMESAVGLPRWCYDVIEAIVDRFWETDLSDLEDKRAFSEFLENLAKAKGVLKNAA